MDDASDTVGDSNFRETSATLYVYARPATLRAYARLATLYACAKLVTLHSHPHEDGPPQLQPNIPPQSQKGSCTQIASLEIPEGDNPYFLFLNFPHRHVARGTMYNKGGSLYTLRAFLQPSQGTYVVWPRFLINLPPRGSVYRIIPEEFAGAEGILEFKNLRIMVQGDVPVHVMENRPDHWSVTVGFGPHRPNPTKTNI
ncbi:hypothetical protein SESBI_31635 [Sesbania bispinosa]|nr:hypothetical protein SESBI_31635 [Sesbania bispinosa]